MVPIFQILKVKKTKKANANLKNQKTQVIVIPKNPKIISRNLKKPMPIYHIREPKNQKIQRIN
jgi:hypothetical protein